MLKLLDSIDTDKPRSDLSDDFDTIAKKYLHSLIARSPYSHKKVQEASYYIDLLSEPNRHDVTSSMVFLLAQQNGYFNDWIATLLINKSKVPFLLPMCGVYEFGYESVENLVMPVDPYKAIQLVFPVGASRFCEVDHIKYGLVAKEAIVRRLNVFAFETQIDHDYGYVISRDVETIREAEKTYNQMIESNAVQGKCK